MCGINGIISLSGAEIPDPERLIAGMNSAIAHRGPDDLGYWTAPGLRLALGHRRLSILDLSSAGHQPMSTGDGHVISYNGEVYNYTELKERFFPGHAFRSGSDTEVILELLKKQGTSALSLIQGMFAFAYWNPDKAELLLARDRMGKKPLYYSATNGYLSFSSEIKALLSLPWMQASPDEEALYHFLTFNQLPPPFTLFKGIRKLAPGHYLKISRSSIEEVKFWEITPEDLTSLNRNEVADRLYDTLEAAVNKRMVSDVPIGAFLSGGVDSSAVVAFMSNIGGRKVTTYSVGFDGMESYDEREAARSIASRYATDHHEISVSAAEIAGTLPEIIDIFDEPMADATCIPIHFISRLARSKGTPVVLTGDGADELFAGYRSWQRYIRLYPHYHRYLQLPKVVRKIAYAGVTALQKESNLLQEMLLRASEGQEFFWGGARAFKESVKRELLTPEFNASTRNYHSYAVIESYRREFDQLKKKSHWLDDTAWMCFLGLKFQIPAKYLYRMDRLGMANSIEIRNPFLDTDMVNLAFSFPSRLKYENNEPKYILKKCLERMLPTEILYRKKMGFCVPLQEWAGDIMLDYTITHMRDFSRNTGLFSEDGIQKEIDAIRKGRTTHTNQLWTIYFLMAWFKRWMNA